VAGRKPNAVCSADHRSTCWKSMQIGGAIGLAIVTAVLAAGNRGKSGPDALLAGFTPAMITVTVLAVIGLLAALSGTLGRRTATAQTDKNTDQPELGKVA
jgi:hypothetical protein